MSLSSWIFLLPLQVMHGELISPAVPLVSLMTLPILVGFIFPLLCLSLSSSAELSSAIIRVSTVGLESLAEVIARIAPPVLLSPLWFFLALAAAALILNVAPIRRVKIRATLSVITISIFCNFLFSPRPHEVIEQLDVGQGDSALISYLPPAHVDLRHGLIDSASPYGLKRIDWIRLFGSRRIRGLDWILLTHWDSDHVGGLPDLLGLIPIRCVVLPRASPQTDLARQLLQEFTRLGVRQTREARDCIPFPVTTVSSSDPRQRRTGNQVMGAILVKLSRGIVYVNAGDSDVTQERALLPWIRPHLIGARKVIVKLSHHGSKTSTGPLWLKELGPEELWISAGLGNRYGHPSKAVLDRVMDRAGGEARVRRTDRDGLIHFSN